MFIEDKLYSYLTIYQSLPLWLKNIIGFLYRLVPYQIRYGRFYSIYKNRIKFFNKLSKKETKRQYLKILFLNVNQSIKTINFYSKFNFIYSIDDFENLPIITKDTINHNKNIFINKDQINNKLHANTGGSSGTPFSFFIQKGITRSKESAHFDWFWSRFGYKKGIPILVIRGKALKKRASYEYSSLDNKLILNCNEINKNTISEIIERIKIFKPQFIHAYPSALLIFTKICKLYTDNTHFNFKIRGIFLGSEGASSSDLSLFKKYYNSKIINWYGHSECSIFAERIGFENEFFFHPFYGYVELVDEKDKVIKSPNITGRIIATSFDNNVMPLIRYDTGDLGELKYKINKNDLTSQFIINIQGRDKNFIFLRNKNLISLTSLIFGEHHEEFEFIREFQIIQNKYGVIDLLIIPLNKHFNFIKLKERILNCVEKDQLILNIKIVDFTKKTPRGKHILLIQNIK